MKKIPATLKRFADKIDSVEDARGDRNGWWVFLKPGWVYYDGCHQIHEDTLGTIARCFEMVKACECRECVDLMRWAELLQEAD